MKSTHKNVLFKKVYLKNEVPMSLEALSIEQNQVMSCSVKDNTGLNDFQKLPNRNGISIPRVGIERFRIPLSFKLADGSSRSHDTEASMFVFLDGQKTGVNMSRFCAILQEAADRHVVDEQFFHVVLERFRRDLRDYETESLIPKAELELKFKFGVKQPSLKSENWGWQYYDCILKGEQTEDGKTTMTMILGYEYSSTCPCSLSMAKQYEEDFRQGRTTEGNGIATAHSQRSLATCEITYDHASGYRLETLIDQLRKAVPTETQSLVKRLDEQAFAILNGENPMFVEHVSRRLATVFNDDQRILFWRAKIEHFESLHSHNAVAYIHKA
jgi:GTP cyclohydrolase IB